jgi:hypothetical protein
LDKFHFMIRFTLGLLLIAGSFKSSFAQDTLYLKNGSNIAAKILEVGTEEIRYKRFDNPEGPLFISKKSEINSIRYQNGATELINKPVVVIPPAPRDMNPPIYRRGPFYQQDYNRMKAREMHQVISRVNDPDINKYVKQAKIDKGIEYVGFIAIPSFIFAAGYGAVALLSNLDSGPAEQMSYAPVAGCAVLAAATLTTSIVFKFRGRNHNNAALKIYNEKY